MTALQTQLAPTVEIDLGRPRRELNASDIAKDFRREVKIAREELLKKISAETLLELGGPNGETLLARAIRSVAVSKPEALLAFATKIMPTHVVDTERVYSPVVIQMVTDKPLEGIVIKQPPPTVIVDDGL